MTRAAAPAVAISKRNSPGERGPGSKRRSGDPSYAPLTLALHTRAIARTAATCWGRRPGTERRARILVISKGRAVTAERARAVRRTCPPPSPEDPSMEIRDTPKASPEGVLPGASRRLEAIAGGLKIAQALRGDEVAGDGRDRPSTPRV